MTALAMVGAHDIRDVVCSYQYIELVDTDHYSLSESYNVKLNTTG